MDEMLPLLKKGDSWAYEQLIKEYKKLLLTSVFRHYLNYNDFDDFFNNVMIKVFRKINQYKPEYAMFTWMKKIAQNECISFLELKENRCWSKLNHIEDYSVGYIDYTLYTETVFDKYEDIRVAMNMLKPEEKDIIDKYYLKGWSSEDIGIQYNVSAQCIRNKLPKILIKLKRRLHEEAKGYSTMVG